jgi:cytochrome b561
MAAHVTEFSLLRRSLHWLVAAFIAFQVPLAWIMVDQKLGPDKLGNYALHKSLGICLFAIGVSRVIVALTTSRPPLPPDMRLPARIMARGTEVLLFLLVVMMPVTGWLMSSAANFPVSFFGLFTLPDLVKPDETLFEALRGAHRMQSYVLLTLLTLHFAAACRHFFILRDNVLYTMLPWRRLKR